MNYLKPIVPAVLSLTMFVACTDPNDVNEPSEKRPAADMSKPAPDMSPDMKTSDAGDDTDMKPSFVCPQDCAPAPSAAISCDDDEQCVYTCDAGLSDLNDDLGQRGGDGCESQCVPSNGGVELCDGEDNDCDGAVDEDFTDLGTACLATVMACSFDGKLACAPDKTSLTCVTDQQPTAELCDGVDNNCDGTIDEGFEDKGKECTSGQGVCTSTALWECSDDKTALECPAVPNMNASNYEAQEMSCDNLDNDCDGEVDDGCDDDGDEVCDKAMTVVGSPTICPKGKDDCKDDDADVYPGAPGKCDGKDNDCDGEVDEVGADLSVTPPTFKIQWSTSMVTDYANFAQRVPPNTIESATPSVMAAAGKTGFCFVGIDRRNRRIHTQWLRPDGTSMRNYATLPTSSTTVSFNIMDVKVGVGAAEHCAFILSETGKRVSGDAITGRIHAGLWVPGNGNTPSLYRDTLTHKVDGGDAIEWLDQFAMYAAMTSYTRTVNNAQEEVFGIFIHDPGPSSSADTVLKFAELTTTTPGVSALRLVDGGGGRDESRKSSRLQIAAYAKSQAEQYVYFSQGQGGTTELWRIIAYNAVNNTRGTTITPTFDNRVTSVASALFPYTQAAFGYLRDQFTVGASTSTKSSEMLGSLTGGTIKTPWYRSRNVWAPELPGTNLQWMIDPLTDRVVTVPNSSGVVAPKVAPHGNATFNQLLAIGQLDGKIYAADMTNFGAASGMVDPQLKLYPYTCH